MCISLLTSQGCAVDHLSPRVTRSRSYCPDCFTGSLKSWRSSPDLSLDVPSHMLKGKAKFPQPTLQDLMFTSPCGCPNTTGDLEASSNTQMQVWMSNTPMEGLRLTQLFWSLNPFFLSWIPFHSNSAAPCQHRALLMLCTGTAAHSSTNYTSPMVRKLP